MKKTKIRHLKRTNIIKLAWAKNRKFVKMRLYHYQFIIKRYIELCFLNIVFKNKEWKLPKGCGTVFIERFKHRLKLNKLGRIDTRNTRINWGATRNLWLQKNPDKTIVDFAKEFPNEPSKKVVYFDYTKTNDIIYKIKFRKNKNIKGSNFRFSANYGFRKLLVDKILNQNFR